MMTETKKDLSKKRIAWALVAGGIGLVIFWLTRTTLFQNMVSTVVNYYGFSLRFKIGYLLGSILIAGMILYVLQRLFKRDIPASKPLLRTKPPQWLSKLTDFHLDPGKNNENTKLLILGVAIIGMGAFYIFPFTHAFIMAALLLLGMFFIFREDKRKLLIMGALVVILCWVPYLVKGPDTHVKIFDNLDCHIPQTKILAESGKAFSLDPGTRLDPLINGLRLSGVDSGFNVMTWLFMIFPPFMAYALNELLVRLIAFFGMVLFLKEYVIPGGKEERYFLVIGVGICFACLPFYPAAGISIAGIPLLLVAFLNILKRKYRYVDFVVIMGFPFYSKLALAGLFIAVVLFIIFVVDGVRRRAINWVYLGGLGVLTVLYVFTHFHLVYSLLFSNVEMFREEISVESTATLLALKDSVWNFLFDRVNEVGAQQLFVVGAAALAVVTATRKKLDIRLLMGLVTACMVTALLWGFKYWSGIMPLRERFQLLNAFDFSRFYWLNPFLWYVIFALALVVILELKWGKVMVGLLIFGQVVFMFMNYNWEYRYLLGVQGSFAGSARTYSLTFQQFYSPQLFKDIRDHIGKPLKDYRVVSFGMHPGIAQFNGFYTLDIYTDVYPLEYKHRFREVFARELQKSPELQKAFDDNAKRCFLMSAELHGIPAYRGMVFSRGITRDDPPLVIKKLELNTGVLKALGGEYIFSVVEIANYKENNLELAGIFKSRESPWRIFLYQVL